MDVLEFFSEVRKRKSIAGTLCVAYHGVFDKYGMLSGYREFSDKFIVVQLYKFISVNESHIAEKIIALSELARIPDTISGDYTKMIVSILEDTLSRKGD